ncbi:hypothetical protein MOPEL_067_00100 [Mobilicoccus pelagius NBRC 104925]|uniref:Uncharacterized protein n=1 Tax=Mobilicoccus pelagius NBRC 104925 TaxID=1089455 RepID=H5UR03_9MICO|nr:hypothetical protein MOPEL_067_00100 [Mobilicoccus pelagius NBRC 104925]
MQSSGRAVASSAPTAASPGTIGRRGGDSRASRRRARTRSTTPTMAHGTRRTGYAGCPSITEENADADATATTGVRIHVPATTYRNPRALLPRLIHR